MSEIGIEKNVNLRDIVAEMRAGRSDDGGDVVEMGESMMAFLWVLRGVIRDGGEAAGMGDGIDGRVGMSKGGCETSVRCVAIEWGT